MFTKKNAIGIVSFLFFSGAAMSEPTSAGTDGQAGFNAEQNRQTSQNTQLDTDKQNEKAASNKQSSAKKKPSMVDYCRKNLC